MMLISISVIMMIYYVAVYQYEKAVLQSVIAFEMEYSAERNLGEDETKVEIMDAFSGQLNLIQVKSVDIRYGVLERRAGIQYELNLKNYFLKELLMKGKKQVAFSWKKEFIKPSYYRWDAEQELEKN